MREAPNAGPRVVQNNRHARAKADRDERLLIAAHGAIGNLDANLGRRFRVDHERRKTRSRASRAVKRARTGPRSVSTLPRTRYPPGARTSWNRASSRSWVSRSK